jgi:hypothetical protein
MLRLFIYLKSTKEDRVVYLSQQEHWQQGEGHPWMLINAYRALLLAASGKKADAKLLLEQAIDDCLAPDNGALLHWMAKVLFALATSFGIDISEPNISVPNHLPTASLAKLANSSITPSERLQYLEELLPFNFH